ncbi:LTA synthase family protein [Paenibacillus sp. USDA918EY]|uniref:LTA synthase family protein n=1 Tax=Paenibacillus sp. USDA918EY TaxID=2689575 RepID=UPI00135C20F8|nr:alkaline phosphatase family protein [Paenibacillus sp. USDA918EY]
MNRLNDSKGLRLCYCFIFVLTYTFGRYLLYNVKGLRIDGITFISGFISDILFCLFILGIVYLTSKILKIIPYFVLFFLVFFHLANIEYIYAMDGLINLHDFVFLGDKEFISGSLTHVSFPIYSLVLFVTALIVLLGLKKHTITSKKLFFMSGIFGLLFFISLTLFGDGWQSSNFVSASISNSVHFNTASAVNLNEVPNELIEEVTKSGVVGEGKPLIDLAKKKNVILVVMEGIPGVYLPENQNFFGIKNKVTLESLQEIKDHSIIVPNFMTHNNQTIRGLYSILSGEYPKLDSSTPKAYEYLQNENSKQRMLPSEMGKIGYNTAYIQAAPLEFMSKDRFMQKSGFNTIIGSEGFTNNYIPFGWGADDRTFFEQSLNYIDTINQKGKPWFVTLLTVGTHHPYAVPDDLAAQYKDRKDAAVKYLDQSLKEFIQGVQNSEYAKDTVVVFTSDESHGVITQPFGSNWGICLVYSPDIEKEIINEDVFGQKDILNSILDYINPGAVKNSYGRSIFRDYVKQAPIIFASHYSGDVYFSPEKGKVIQLNNKNQIYRIESNNGQMFSESYKKYKVDDQKLKEQLNYYKKYFSASSITSGLNIILNKKFNIKHGETSILADGQFLTLPKNKYINISFDYVLENPKKGDNIRFQIEDRENMNMLNIKSIDYTSSSGKIEYSFYNKEEITGYNFVLFARASSNMKEALTVNISNLVVNFNDMRSNSDSSNLINSFPSDRLSLLDNLVPLMATQNGAYITSDDHLVINSADMNSYLVYGPYISYPAGKYKLILNIKLKGSFQPNDKLFKLEVSYDSGNKIATDRDFSIKDLVKNSNETFTAELPFELTADTSNVEFRLKGKRALDMEIIDMKTN